jgi:hypothetical protein
MLISCDTNDTAFVQMRQVEYFCSFVTTGTALV